MSAPSIDTNKLINFVLHWTCAGLWATIGYQIAAKFVIPNVPFL